MIGVFDSGFGGLTILKSIRERLPEYDYLYLGDNARTPYGTRSFEVVYQYTLECVRYLFSRGCHLIILACNTASAKALRNIQQNDLPHLYPDRRVLGIIRPTVEAIEHYTTTRHIGLLATPGTVNSMSYPIEISKHCQHITLTQQPCPMWVPLVENNEHHNAGANYFVEQYINQLLSTDPLIDTILLACTHYPLLAGKINEAINEYMNKHSITDHNINLLSQGSIVAASLEDYLRRHPEIERYCEKNGGVEFLTTESAERFSESAAIFMGEQIEARHVEL